MASSGPLSLSFITGDEPSKTNASSSSAEATAKQQTSSTQNPTPASSTTLSGDQVPSVDLYIRSRSRGPQPLSMDLADPFEAYSRGPAPITIYPPLLNESQLMEPMPFHSGPNSQSPHWPSLACEGPTSRSTSPGLTESDDDLDSNDKPKPPYQPTSYTVPLPQGSCTGLPRVSSFPTCIGGTSFGRSFLNEPQVHRTPVRMAFLDLSCNPYFQGETAHAPTVVGSSNSSPRIVMSASILKDDGTVAASIPLSPDRSNIEQLDEIEFCAQYQHSMKKKGKNILSVEEMLKFLEAYKVKVKRDKKGKGVDRSGRVEKN
ncbi:hypothetical protein CC78DRAFT_574956 [Lojkania enalia]|uniref:Uncharacterized protein n=1 Tax=Lojkania enalia TaxID=147567 RepID=A0A9P4TQA0_9PLEO|nr:hypothetical protein CC78DRAFT_574956 [Didymosphaeria enalia]